MRIDYSGKRYTDTVPDTLDLAERARLAVHGVTGCVDPDMLMMYFRVAFCTARPFLGHVSSADTTCDPKFGEALPMLRTMCGSDENAELEARYFADMSARVRDGLYWDLYTPKRPWRNGYGESYYGKGKDEDFAVVGATGLMMRAMNVWRQLGADESSIDEQLRDMVRGMRRIAVFRDDYCYYPEKGGWGEACTYPRSGWINTDEAKSDTEGAEGAVTAYHGNQIYGAALWHMRSGDTDALDLAARLTRYCMEPRFWGGLPNPGGDRDGLVGHVASALPDPAYTNGSGLGHWYSHFHARCITLRGMFQYACAANDTRVLEFIRRAYEFSLSQGIPAMGWINCFPAATGETARNGAEGCSLGDLVALGIGLSDAGLGDYWDDVDAVVRNHLAEQQLTKPEELERICALFRGKDGSERDQEEPPPGQRTVDNVIPRIVGIFGAISTPVALRDPWVMQCCTGNAARGLYYAWEGSVREDGDTAQVNLLLNRASRLLDIHSYLPYEGKVVIRNKAARRIAVRIPAWIDRRRIRIDIDGKAAEPDWIGNRLILCRQDAPNVITIAFPVRETTVAYTVNAHSEYEQAYTCTFRGGTLVGISPRDTRPTSYPLYLRDHLRADEAPMRTVERFVADRIVTEW
ncbi:hypothetical protein ACFLSJ_00090 [Verrucomicrobiota bacterium]